MYFLLITSGSDLIFNEFCSYIWFVYRCLTDWARDVYLDCWLMGEGEAYGGLIFLGTGSPVPDLHSICIWYDMFGILFLYVSISLGYFCSWTIALKNGSDNIQWASYISDLRTRLRVISRSISGFATGFPCGIWGRGWTTILLYGGPILGVC